MLRRTMLDALLHKLLHSGDLAAGSWNVGAWVA